jgi:hypothetical protein
VIRVYQPTLLSTRLPFLQRRERIDSHVVVTLDPNKFAEKKQRRLDISNLSGIRLHLLHDQSVAGPRLHYDRALESGKHKSFPPDTKAFLYYYGPPERPPISGELRFRVASSDDSESFESGFDLLKPNHQPWSRPLYVVSKYSIPLYEKLREDQLVSDNLDAVLSTFRPEYIRYARTQNLYTLNDSFVVKFGSREQQLFVVTERGMETLPLTGPFYDQYAGSRTIPYTGAYTNHHISVVID